MIHHTPEGASHSGGEKLESSEQAVLIFNINSH